MDGTEIFRLGIMGRFGKFDTLGEILYVYFLPIAGLVYDGVTCGR